MQKSVETFPGSSGDALRYWELRRLVYNCVLTAVIIRLGCIDVARFRNALTFSSFLRVTVSRVAGERLLRRRLRRRHFLVAVIP
jgi:hypothetical protein